MKKEVHPLLILAAGVAFGTGFGYILAVSFPDVGTVGRWCGGGAIVGGIVVGGAIVVTWLYNGVPEIRAATQTAFLWGTIVGGFLSLMSCLVSLFTGSWPAHQNAQQDAVGVGVIFAVGGFLVGCALAVGRVFLRRKRDADPNGETGVPKPK